MQCDRSRRCRLCVPEMNHPIRVAERCATLDIISRGRLEVGTARSSTWTELGGFNVDPDDTKKTWDEFVPRAPELLADGHFVLPGPRVLDARAERAAETDAEAASAAVGDGHEPGHRARRRRPGLGCLGVAAAGYAEQERRTKEYFRRIELCDPVGDVVTREATTLNFLYCHEDAAVAARTGMGMVGMFGLANSHLMWTREAFPTSGLPVTRQPRPQDRPRERRPGRGVRHPRGHLRRRPRHRDGNTQAVGVDRRHRHQLPGERARGRPAGTGARVDAALRSRSHAEVPRVASSVPEA